MPAGPPTKIIPQSLNDYLEIMSKSVFQSGMSWKVVESKWPGTREAFKFMGPSGIYVFLYIVGEEVIPHEEFEKQYRNR